MYLKDNHAGNVFVGNESDKRVCTGNNFSVYDEISLLQTVVVVGYMHS